MDLDKLNTEELIEMKKKIEGKINNPDLKNVDLNKLDLPNLNQTESNHKPRRLDHIILRDEEIEELSQSKREFDGKIYNPEINDIDLIKSSINSKQNESTSKKINHIILTDEEIEELRRHR